MSENQDQIPSYDSDVLPGTESFVAHLRPVEVSEHRTFIHGKHRSGLQQMVSFLEQQTGLRQAAAGEVPVVVVADDKAAQIYEGQDSSAKFYGFEGQAGSYELREERRVGKDVICDLDPRQTIVFGWRSNAPSQWKNVSTHSGRLEHDLYVTLKQSAEAQQPGRAASTRRGIGRKVLSFGR